MSELRIGQGVDVHAFTKGDHVMLAGVRIEHSKALAAHSDGDVAVHALCDALLGAASLGDIGQHFPPGEPEWSDASGARLLSGVQRMLGEQGWRMVNCDITIACEVPKISPHVFAMRTALAKALESTIDRISIKATTTEKLGFCGRGEGIAALAVALIERS